MSCRHTAGVRFALIILNLGCRRGQVVDAALGSLTQWLEQWYRLHSKSCPSHAGLYWVRWRAIVPPGFKPRTVQRVARHYDDYAIAETLGMFRRTSLSSYFIHALLIIAKYIIFFSPYEPNMSDFRLKRWHQEYGPLGSKTRSLSLKFRRNIRDISSRRKQSAGFSKTSLLIYQTTRHHIPNSDLYVWKCSTSLWFSGKSSNICFSTYSRRKVSWIITELPRTFAVCLPVVMYTKR